MFIWIDVKSLNYVKVISKKKKKKLLFFVSVCDDQRTITLHHDGSSRPFKGPWGRQTPLMMSHGWPGGRWECEEPLSLESKHTHRPQSAGHGATDGHRHSGQQKLHLINFHRSCLRL